MPSGFWSTQTLRDRLPTIVEPFDESRLDVCAYHLSMGSEAFVSSDQARKHFLHDWGHVTIPPGQFAQLLTREALEMPDDAIGFISLRTGRKAGGLINVSGFHVDPGYRGRLIFSVYNAGTGPIVISYGEPVFGLWFASLDGPVTEGYGGERQGLTRIRDKDVAPLTRSVPSAAALERRVSDVEHRARNAAVFASIAITIVITLVAAIFGGVVTPGS